MNLFFEVPLSLDAQSLSIRRSTFTQTTSCCCRPRFRREGETINFDITVNAFLSFFILFYFKNANHRPEGLIESGFASHASFENISKEIMPSVF